jgi:hypothetical protein
MNRDKIDQLWSRALGQSINAGEAVTRYHFTALVLEEAARVCEENGNHNITKQCAADIRAMKPEVK